MSHRERATEVLEPGFGDARGFLQVQGRCQAPQNPGRPVRLDGAQRREQSKRCKGDKKSPNEERPKLEKREAGAVATLNYVLGAGHLRHRGGVVFAHREDVED